MGYPIFRQIQIRKFLRLCWSPEPLFDSSTSTSISTWLHVNVALLHVDRVTGCVWSATTTQKDRTYKKIQSQNCKNGGKLNPFCFCWRSHGVTMNLSRNSVHFHGGPSPSGELRAIVAPATVAKVCLHLTGKQTWLVIQEYPRFVDHVLIIDVHWCSHIFFDLFIHWCSH